MPALVIIRTCDDDALLNSEELPAAVPSSATRNLKVSADIDSNTRQAFKVSEKIWQHGFTEQPLAFVPHAKWPHGFAGARWKAELRHGLASFPAAPFTAAIRFRQRNAFAHSDGCKLARPPKNSGCTRIMVHGCPPSRESDRPARIQT